MIEVERVSYSIGDARRGGEARKQCLVKISNKKLYSLHKGKTCFGVMTSKFSKLIKSQ